jgi:hypothetical protein
MAGGRPWFEDGRRAVNQPGFVERWQLSRPGVIAAAGAGIVLGGFAGATLKGSGMFFSNLILGGVLLVFLVLVGICAVAAALMHRTRAARILAGFIGMTVIATGVAYAVAPRYRSTDEPFDHRGSVTISLTELGVAEWRAEATCRRGPRDRTVTQVYIRDVHATIGDRWFSFGLWLSPGATSVQAGTLSFSLGLPGGSSVSYSAPPGDAMEATLVSADGLTGSLQFSAAPIPDPYHPNPEFDRLTGTFEWACASTPSD